MKRSRSFWLTLSGLAGIIVCAALSRYDVMADTGETLYRMSLFGFYTSIYKLQEISLSLQIHDSWFTRFYMITVPLMLLLSVILIGISLVQPHKKYVKRLRLIGFSVSMVKSFMVIISVAVLDMSSVHLSVYPYLSILISVVLQALITRGQNMDLPTLFHFRLTTFNIAVTGLLTALNIIMTRFLSIPLGATLRISFGFLLVGIAGSVLGPVPAMIVGGLGDFIGAIALPIGTYHPGFTLTAALSGLIYGFFFYKQDKLRLYHIILSNLFVVLLLNIGLNTLWLMQLYHRAYIAMLPARVLKNIMQYPIDVLLIYLTIPIILRAFRHFRKQ